MMRVNWGRPGWRDQRGTSLTEVAIATSLLGLVMVPTLLLWGKAQESYFEGVEMTEAQGNLRVALDDITRDVRRAGYRLNLTGPAFDAILTATATTLQVQMDRDDNGTIAGSDEDVTYAFDAVNRRLTRNGATLAERIGNAAFTYWWSPVIGSGTACGAGALVSGQAPTAPQRGCIRRVTVTVVGQATIGGQTLTRTARTDVDVRAR